MERPDDLGWRQFSASLVQSLRWPLAFVVVVLLLRAPLTRVIETLSSAIAN